MCKRDRIFPYARQGYPSTWITPIINPLRHIDNPSPACNNEDVEGTIMKNTGEHTFSPILVGILVLLYLLALGWFTYMNYMAGSSELWMMLTNGLILSIPLVLLFFSIGVLVTAWQQRRRQGWVGAGLAKFIHYTPRIAAILITLFVGLFSLDVFGQGTGFWETLGGFLMHNIPTIIMGIVVWFAWRRPQIGFIAFLIVGIFFMRFFLTDGLQGIGNLMLFSGPMLLIAMLFYADWKWAKQPLQPSGV